MSIRQQLFKLVDRAGYAIQRTDAARRAQLLINHGVDLVMDVGAAVGQYAHELRRYGYTGDIISFEPLDSAYEQLRTASQHDARWRIVKTAVGSADCEAQINIARNSDSSSLLSMDARHSAAAPGADFVSTQLVRVQRLDALVMSDVATHKAPFLKIDAQGYEREVLSGATATVASVVGMQIEMSFVSLYEGSMLFDELVAWTAREGFHLEGLEPGFRDPRTQELLQADGLFFR